MKRLTRKLKSKRGETLVEILVSIMILGLSVGFMALMIQTSYIINQQARDMDDSYYTELENAEKMVGTGTYTKVRIGSVEIDVEINGSTDGEELRSYSLH